MWKVQDAQRVDRWFEPWSGQTKDNKIGICCFSAKNAALRRKSKDWLARYQDNVSEWSDMSIHVCCFSELALNKIQLSMLDMNYIKKNAIFDIFHKWP
jgi:uncharacterized protein YaeQ